MNIKVESDWVVKTVATMQPGEIGHTSLPHDGGLRICLEYDSQPIILVIAPNRIFAVAQDYSMDVSVQILPLGTKIHITL